MSSDCIRISDAIWDFARDGVKLTEEDLRHIGSCSSCAAALVEAQAGVAALNSVRAYPTAPDCRSSVTNRISMRRTRLMPTWAYACAAFLVTLLVGGALLLPHGGRPDQKQATRLTKAPSYTPREALLPIPEPKPEVRVRNLARPRAPQHLRLRKPSFKRYDVASHGREELPAKAVAPAEPRPATQIAEPHLVPPADDSSALAYVTWSTASQPKDSYRYSYTTTDPVTGEVTKCTVKRNGSAIEINMESSPAKPETKPTKESKSNEVVDCG